MIKLIMIFGIISVTNATEEDNSTDYLFYLIKHNKFNSALVELDRLEYDSKKNTFCS